MSNSYQIAVVGVAALFPGSEDRHGFWKDILAGRDLVTEIPSTHWSIADYYDPDPKAPDKIYAKRGAFLNEVAFDPLKNGIPPKIIPVTDTSQILALVVAQAVLDDALNGQFTEMARERASVILGVTSGQELLTTLASRLQRPVWRDALRKNGVDDALAEKICQDISDRYPPWEESSFPGLLGNVIAGRIANRFDLRGTNCITDAACASSLSALSMSINELVSRQSDLVITGGVDTMNDVCMYTCFSKTPALSRSGDCRPFSSEADGTLLGEGLGMFALKRLEDAEANGDRIYAVIRGLGSSSDGKSKSIYAPRPEGQIKALRRAYDVAGYGPETVELVEAHGTGTIAGDAAEFAALNTVFTEAGEGRHQWCALGSVKSQIGHTKAAAGAAGLFKAVMALHHKILPPTIKINQPNAALHIEESPFYLNTQARPWITSGHHPRRAAVSSFGFGGSNFHLTLEEYRGASPLPAKTRYAKSELFVISAGNAAQLVDKAREMEASSEDLSDVARASQSAYSRQECRVAIIASDLADLKKKLGIAFEKIIAAPDRAWSLPQKIFYGTGAPEGRLGFVFPGQGSQYTQMGADIAMNFDVAREIWDAASSINPEMRETVFPRPAFGAEAERAKFAAFKNTSVVQPAIAAMSAALLGLLREIGVKASAVAGHSLGALTALYSAGAINFSDLLRACRARGEAMEEAGKNNSGGMLAVFAAEATLSELIGQGRKDLVGANYNHPQQTVLSGSNEAIEAASSWLEEKNIQFKALPVSGAFHSPLMQSASEDFSKFLQSITFQKARIEVFDGVDRPSPTSGEIDYRQFLADQILEPVQFIAQIKAMYEAGVRTFIEVGPGNILQSFIAQILKDLPHQVIALDKRGTDGMESLWEALARLTVAGVDMDLSALWKNVATSGGQANGLAGRMTVAVHGANPKFPLENTHKTSPQAQRVSKRDDKSHDLAQDALPIAVEAVDAKPQTDVTRQYDDGAARRDSDFNLVSEAPSSNEAAPQSMQEDSPFITASQNQEAQNEAASRRTALLASSLATSQNESSVVTQTMTGSSIKGLEDVSSILMDIVAETTGYPVEMLETNMELEADLGVDSIKRIEIFSALRQRVPSLPEVDASELSALRSLDQIITRLSAETRALVASPEADRVEALEAHPVSSAQDVNSPHKASSLAATSSTASIATEAPSAQASAQRNNVAKPALVQPKSTATEAPSAIMLEDVSSILMEIIAETTGYPVEMLETNMELEADLGVDSIKRIEIFSALRQRVPSLPEVDASELSALRSLDQIITRLSAEAAPAPVSGGDQVLASEESRRAAAQGTSFQPEAMESEPASTLSSDKGVNERAQAAMRSSPEASAQQINGVRTAETIDSVKQEAKPASASTSPASTQEDVSKILLEIIAETTGYPVEMLETNMELEADLGVDSIKRIEIFSALRQRVPSLPEVDASELSALRSLDQIITRLSAEAAPAPVSGGEHVLASEESRRAAAEGTSFQPEAMESEPASTLSSDKGVNERAQAAHTARAPKSQRRSDEQTSTPLPNEAPEPPEQTIQRAATNGKFVTDGHAKKLNGVESNGHDRHHALTRSVRSVTPAPLMRFSSVSFGRKIFLAGDRNEVNEDLAQRLAARGLDVVIGQTPPEDADTVIFSFGLHENPEFADTLEAARRLFDVAHKVAPRFEKSGGVFVTLQDTGGDFGLSGQTDHPWVSGFTAFASSAAKEWPKANVKAIDIECGDRQPDDIAAALELELLCGWDTKWVGLREDGQRSTITKKDTDPVTHRSRHLRAMDVILVTGGARGITNAVLQSLTDTTKLRIALLGRQELIQESTATQHATSEKDLKAAIIKEMSEKGTKPTPSQVNKTVSAILKNREIHGNLQKLTDAGNEVRYFSLNIQDDAAVDRIVKEVRADWGPINGLIHGAGELVDKKISALSREEFERVYRTKVIGLRNLLKSTEGEPLKFISLFSSIVASSGNPGQLAYGMANSVLNGVAAWENRRRGKGCRVRSIMWGPWHGGMVTPDLRERFENHGIHCIPLDDGALAATAEVFDADASTAEVIITANGFA